MPDWQMGRMDLPTKCTMTHSLLHEKKFLVCKNFLNPLEASELARLFVSYCDLVKAGVDSDIIHATFVNDYPPFKRIHYEKIYYLNHLLNKKLFPTYTYARIYKKGSVLPPHIDRDACEISVTLNLSKDTEWPIYFGEPGKIEVPVELLPGEAAVYLGREITHWRNEYQGEQQVQVFLHYVDSMGPFAFRENDKLQGYDYRIVKI